MTGGDVVWNDGPLARAVREGAICYLDEVVEARRDTLAVLHSLTDHRHALFLDRNGETIVAPATFMLVCSYNPSYRSALKEMKASFRQRFVTYPMSYVPFELEVRVLVDEAGVDAEQARRLVSIARSIRSADDHLHLEPPSTRTLVSAAQLIAIGLSEQRAVETCILSPLGSDGAVSDGLRELAAATSVSRSRTS